MSPLRCAVALYAQCWSLSMEPRFVGNGFAIEVDNGLRWRVGLTREARFKTQGTTRIETLASLIQVLWEARAFLRCAQGDDKRMRRENGAAIRL